MIAALVKHHPSRAHLLPALTAGLAPLETVVVEDPGASEPRRSCWRCFRACLEQIPDGADHVLIVEDDVTFAADFAAGLERIVDALPHHLLALYLSKGHGRDAVEIGGRPDRPTAGRWVRVQPFVVPVVALLFPRELALRFRDWEAASPQPWSPADCSKAVTRFVKAQRVPMFAPLPSLVEHPDVEPRVLRAGRLRGRTGYETVRGSALAYDWSWIADAQAAAREAGRGVVALLDVVHAHSSIPVADSRYAEFVKWPLYSETQQEAFSRKFVSGIARGDEDTVGFLEQVVIPALQAELERLRAEPDAA